MKNEFNQLVKDLVDSFVGDADGWFQTDAMTQDIVESEPFRRLIKDQNTVRNIFCQAVAQRVRQTIRSKKDENGRSLFANISHEDENGVPIHFYKPIVKCDADDAFKQRSIWISKTIQARNESVFWDKTYTNLTGKQLPLPFDANSFIDD